MNKLKLTDREIETLKEQEQVKERLTAERHQPKPRRMLCFQHGGSEACEAENRKHGFTCPKCSNAGALPRSEAK